MKQALLEYIIRECVVEVLQTLNEAEDPNQPSQSPEEEDDFSDLDTSVPPKFHDNDAAQGGGEDVDDGGGDDGAGEDSGDGGDFDSGGEGDGGEGEEENPNPLPDIPSPTFDEPQMKGAILVNPRDKSKLQPIPLKGDDATIERSLHRVAAALGGNKVKTSISAMNAVRDAVKNPNSPVFVYLGKYDPDSDEIFILADKSLQVAKDNSIEANELGGKVSALPSGDNFNPLSANATDFATRMQAAGAAPRSELDENLKKLISKVLKETFSK